MASSWLRGSCLLAWLTMVACADDKPPITMLDNPATMPDGSLPDGDAAHVGPDGSPSARPDAAGVPDAAQDPASDAQVTSDETDAGSDLDGSVLPADGGVEGGVRPDGALGSDAGVTDG